MKPLAVAGIVGPIGFIILVVVQGIMQPDYSHVSMLDRAAHEECVL